MHIWIGKCSKLFTVCENVTLGPGQTHDSTTPNDVDCYRFLHYWVSAENASKKAMDKIDVRVVFEVPKMGASGLANLEHNREAGIEPTALTVSSGEAQCGWGSFVVRVPVIGPKARVILVNQGAETYKFSVYCYATR